MKLIFSDQPLPTTVTKSIFLAGPSPRNSEQPNWRKEAVELLQSSGFDGEVFIPIPSSIWDNSSTSWQIDYETQVRWELKARQITDTILYWVERDINAGMFGLTTNVEFGNDITTGKVWYGRPDNADKIRYLDQVAQSNDIAIFNDLDTIVQSVVKHLGKGSKRQNGEVNVPLFIWNTEQFQQWYSNVKQNGNRLDDAKVQHFLKFKNGFVFSFVLWVNVWIESEQRNKDNEFIFSRKDISCIMPYYKAPSGETFVVLVKEFRSSCKNVAGLVYELPGGSSMKPNVDPRSNAQHELQEETGIFVADESRFKFEGTKQICATLSTHSSWLYSVELSASEFLKALETAKKQTTFGVVEDTEKTYIEIMPVSKIMEYPLDFSMVGMILGTLKNK